MIVPSSSTAVGRATAIASISLGSVVTTVGGSIATIALPTLSRDLEVDASSAIMVVTAYQLTLLTMLLPLSALGDRIGRARVYRLGMALFSVAAAASLFVGGSFAALVAVRVVQAIGAAASLGVSAALVRDVYPAAQLGRGLALNTLVAATAAALAPSIGGAILSVAPWPWLFAALAPFGVLAALLGRNVLPDGAGTATPFDRTGAVLCTLTFGAIVGGLELCVRGATAPGLVVAALGLAVGAAFVRREARRTDPVLPVDLLRRRGIALPAAGLLVAYLSSMILILYLPFHMQHDLRYSVAESGAVLAAWPLTSLFVAPVSGALSDRYPAGLLGGLGMAVTLLGVAALLAAPPSPSHVDLVWRVILCGMGFAMFYSPNTRQIIAAAPPARASSAGALTSTTRGAGQTLGATLVAALFAADIGDGPWPLLATGALAFVAGLASFAGTRGFDADPPVETVESDAATMTDTAAAVR